MRDPEIILMYDRQCPVCDAYCRQVRVKTSAGHLSLLNARDSSEIRDEVTRRGLDIDQGMVLRTPDAVYYGAEAIHRLALLSPRSDPFNLLNYLAFRWNFAAKVIYPALRFFRNLLLKLLGRTKINNLGLPHNEKF